MGERVVVDLPAGAHQRVHERNRQVAVGAHRVHAEVEHAGPADALQDRSGHPPVAAVAVVEAENHGFGRQSALPVPEREEPRQRHSGEAVGLEVAHLGHEVVLRHEQVGIRLTGGRRANYVIHEDRHGHMPRSADHSGPGGGAEVADAVGQSDQRGVRRWARRRR